jgi:integrase
LEGYGPQERRDLLADYIEWTCCTGLRVEENLRLTWAGIIFGAEERVSVLVPGTKTSAAQATLPLGKAMADLLGRRRAASAGERQVFAPLTYDSLRDAWEHCRKWLGVEHIPTSTAKALRRSAARYLSVERNMP